MNRRREAGTVLRCNKVGFRNDDAVGNRSQCRIVRQQLLTEGVIANLKIRQIDWNHENQDSSAFDVAQKLCSQPSAIGGSFDDAGDICYYQRSVVRQGHDTKVRSKGRERVVGHFGPGCRYRCEKRGFSGIRFPYEAHFCDQLEFKFDPPFVAPLSRLPVAWGLIRRCGIGRVPATAPPSPGNNKTVARLEQFSESRPAA